jgi:hypothetical protein
MNTLAKRKAVVFFLGLTVGAGVLLGVTNASAVGVKLKIEIADFAIEEGAFPAIFAKELCTCELVDNLSQEECQANDNLPSIAHELATLTPEDEVRSGYEVHSKYHGAGTLAMKLGQLKGKERTKDVIEAIEGLAGHKLHIAGEAIAKWDPDHEQFGCAITQDPADELDTPGATDTTNDAPQEP